MEQLIPLIDQSGTCLALLVSISIVTVVSAYLIKRIVDNDNVQAQEFEPLVVEYT